MAIDTIGNLDAELNREGQRRQRQAAASADKQIQSSDTTGGGTADNRNKEGNC